MVNRKPSPEELKLWTEVMSGALKIPTNTVVERSSAKPKLPQRLPPPSTTLDCHGMTLSEAHQATMAHIQGWTGLARNLVVITGRSGRMCQEFPAWVVGHKSVAKVEPLNGGGAFHIKLRKKH